MGYTHYWTNASTKTSDEVVKAFKQKVMRIIAITGVAIEFDQNTRDALWFNGTNDESYETMCFDFTGNGKWNFCKTARNPYDVVVVASLMMAKDIGIIQDWSSDGDDEDFKEATLVYKILEVEHQNNILKEQNASLLAALKNLEDVVSGLEAEYDNAGIGDLHEVRASWQEARKVIESCGS